MVSSKKCPFCGGEPDLIINEVVHNAYEIKDMYFVKCRDCNATTDSRYTAYEAFRLWDRRAD